MAAAAEERPEAGEAGQQHLGWRVALIAAYILCDLSVYLVNARATKGYEPQAVVIAKVLISIVIGSVLAFLQSGPRAVRQCFAPLNVLRLLHVSAFFSLSMVGMQKAFIHGLDGAFIKLLGQMKLPLTALFSRVMFGKKYSLLEWQIILMSCVTCCSYTLVSGDASAPEVSAFHSQGLLFIMAWVLGNVLGTLFAEQAYKAKRLPFTVLMTNIRIGELVCMVFSLTGTSFQGKFDLCNFFQGWDLWTLGVLVTMLGDTWLSGIMVKQLSSVTKHISKCSTLVVLYMFSLGGGKPFSLVQAVAACMIIQTTSLFATSAIEKDRRKAAEVAEHAVVPLGEGPR